MESIAQVTGTGQDDEVRSVFATILLNGYIPPPGEFSKTGFLFFLYIKLLPFVG
jgi:hypothetical protein